MNLISTSLAASYVRNEGLFINVAAILEASQLKLQVNAALIESTSLQLVKSEIKIRKNECVVNATFTK